MANEFKIKNGLVVSGSADIQQDLTVHGTITAEQLNVSIVSSSVLYESGSTKFGDSIDDNHSFTGDVTISGSITLNGQAIGTGKLDETTFFEFTSSYLGVSGSLDNRIDSLETLSSSLDTVFVTENEFDNYTSSLNSFTSSTLMTIGALNNATQSIRSDFNSFTSSYTNVSSSLDSRLDSLESFSSSLDGPFVSDSDFNSYTSSTDYSISSIETSTGSLNSFTSSIDTTIKNKLDTDGVISGSIQVDVTQTTGYSTFSSSIATTTSNLSSSLGNLSSSIATTDLNQNNRLDSIETSTGSLNTFSSSVLSSINNLESVTNTLNSFTSSANVRLNSIESSTSSLNSYTSSTNNRINSIETSTGSLNSYTSSTDDRIGSIETSTGSLNSYTSSTDYRINSIETSTGSLNSFSSSVLSTISTINSTTSSLNSYTSSTNTQLNSIESATSSLNSFTSSIDTTIKNKLDADGVISGSIQIDISQTTGYSSFSSSIASTDSNQDGRLTSIESKTGSYAITGSNSFIGDQIITGSVTITQNLMVLGSSSLLIVTSSQLALSSSVISVNVFEPAERFGGLKVYDSGSAAGTASLLWDSLNNKWIYQNASGSNYSGGMLMMGPRNTGALGDEVGTIANVIMKGMGGDHISGSNITDDGSNVKINSNTTITGSLVVTSTISSTNITSIESSISSLNTHTGSADDRLNSIESTTSSLNSFTNSIDTTIKNKLNSENVVSGSSQILYSGISGVPSGIVSSSAQVLEGTGIWSGSAQLPSGIVSGSSQISYTGLSNVPSGIVSGSSQISYSGISGVPSGIVSGSSQITLSSTTGYVANEHINHTGVTITAGLGLSGGGDITTSRTLHLDTGSSHLQNGIKTYINSQGVVSGSSQILAGTTIHSGSFFNGISVVSGSAQISFGGITGVPSGLVSGSSQITFGSITGVPSGLVSGSSQISYGSITGVPSGIVSGSSQITLSSTTGFGTYLNQAVLTTSTPTFSTVTATTFTGNLTGNASTATSATSATTATYSTNSSKLYSTDAAYAYGSASPYYGYLTYDGTYWQFKVSPATPENVRVYTADRLGGYSYSNSSGANTIVQRDSNGYIQNNYFYTSGGGSERNASGISYFAGFNSSDYYIRSYTVAAVQTALGLGTAAYVAANQNLNTSSSPTFAGVTLSGPIYRTNSGTGYLNGNYSSVETPNTSGAIYTIGGSYVPGTTSLGNMYGIGYGNAGGTAIQMTNATGWGMYVAANGTPYVWLGAEGNASVFRGSVLPHSNNSYNLGSATMGWANVYTNDLHLSNMNKPEGNDVDGTNGTWTIQEGAENLYIINNRNKKKFKITLEEII